jgi:hypothetical protein
VRTKTEALLRRMDAIERKAPAIRLLWITDLTPDTVLGPGDIVLCFTDGTG